jgi:hypothetical protein
VIARLLPLVVLATCSPGGASPGSPTVDWIDRGVEQRIDPGDVCHGAVVQAALELAETASEKSKRVISPDDVAAVAREQAAFRVRFASPRAIRNRPFARDLAISEVLIPMTGAFAQGRTTVLYADPEYAETNQLVQIGSSKARGVLDGCRR